MAAVIHAYFIIACTVWVFQCDEAVVSGIPTRATVLEAVGKQHRLQFAGGEVETMPLLAGSYRLCPPAGGLQVSHAHHNIQSHAPYGYFSPIKRLFLGCQPDWREKANSGSHWRFGGGEGAAAGGREAAEGDGGSEGRACGEEGRQGGFILRSCFEKYMSCPCGCGARCFSCYFGWGSGGGVYYSCSTFVGHKGVHVVLESEYMSGISVLIPLYL